MTTLDEFLETLRTAEQMLRASEKTVVFDLDGLGEMLDLDVIESTHSEVEGEKADIVKGLELLKDAIKAAGVLDDAIVALLAVGYPAIKIRSVPVAALSDLDGRIKRLMAARALFVPEGASAVTESFSPERPTIP